MRICIEICGVFFNRLGLEVTSRRLSLHKTSSIFIHARISSLHHVSFTQVTNADFLQFHKH